MGLIDMIKTLVGNKRVIDLKSLPSQGLFYKDDFKITIKKASPEDIEEYEYDFIKNLVIVVNKIKKVVKNNVHLSNGYKFEDIKSIDVIYIFLEIVKFTLKRPIIVTYDNIDISNNLITGSQKSIEFGEDTFNYYKLSDNIMKTYDNVEKCFKLHGYKYTLPTIGIEDSLSLYLTSKTREPDVDKYNSYFFDFIYFLGHKSTLTYKEIENLIQIFNSDIEGDEMAKLVEVVKDFSLLQVYSLKDGNNIIDLNSKIDLERIWKI